MQWSRTWLLKFNAAKCKLLQIGNSLPYSYFMLDSLTSQPAALNTVHEEKDLGIWCTSDLKPSLHCQRAAAKVMQVLGLIRRSFAIITPDMFTFLYKMCVRPHLEYGVPVWCPYYAKDVDFLEKVQRCATKLLSSLSHLPYVTRLLKLEFYSLYCSRQRRDLIETFEILNGYYDIDPTMFFSTDTTRGHQFKLFKT